MPTTCINIRELVNNEISEKLDKLEKDRLGYAFDSLVFRFKEYQQKAEEGDIYMYMAAHRCDRKEAAVRVHDRHTRDLMRFIQILDDIIGEHN